MTTTPSEGHASLSEAVTAIPGVLAIEPGVASTLRAVDARLRRIKETPARFGIITDDSTATIIIEVSLTDDRLIRDTVTEVQQAVGQFLSRTTKKNYTVHVRVQSRRSP